MIFKCSIKRLISKEKMERAAIRTIPILTDTSLAVNPPSLIVSLTRPKEEARDRRYTHRSDNSLLPVRIPFPPIPQNESRATLMVRTNRYSEKTAIVPQNAHPLSCNL